MVTLKEAKDFHDTMKKFDVIQEENIFPIMQPIRAVRLKSGYSAPEANGRLKRGGMNSR